MTDLYNILGVNKNATIDEIKKKYKKLALEFHPDKSTPENKEQNELKFKEITNAYQVLSDQQKRKSYDLGGQLPDMSNLFNNFNFNLFNNFTRPPRFNENAAIPEKIIYIDLTLEEMYNGCIKEVMWKRTTLCQICDGKNYISKDDCITCKGSGMIQETNRQAFFVNIVNKPCNNCKGKGFFILENCSCNGDIYEITERKKFSFKHGVKHDDQIRLDMKGDQVSKNKFQTAIIVVRQIKHNIFVRDKQDNIHVRINISLYDSIYKDVFKITNLDGNILKFTSDEVLSPIKEYRMEGVGFNKKDLIIRFKIEYPKKNDFINK